MADAKGLRVMGEMARAGVRRPLRLAQRKRLAKWQTERRRESCGRQRLWRRRESDRR